MKENRQTEQLNKAWELAGRLEKEIGEAKEISQYDGESMLPWRYACEAAINAAVTSEKVNCLMRELVAGMELEETLYREYRKDLIAIHGITIRYERRILEVRLPMLVPHRKSQYAEYLEKPLTIALQGWCVQRKEKGDPVPEFKRAALCFVHHYCAGMTVRDHDNVEAKHVQDILALFFMQADDGRHLDLYHTSEEGETNCTWLYLMEHRDFPEWVVQRTW